MSMAKDILIHVSALLIILAFGIITFWISDRRVPISSAIYVVKYEKEAGLLHVRAKFNGRRGCEFSASDEITNHVIIFLPRTPRHPTNPGKNELEWARELPILMPGEYTFTPVISFYCNPIHKRWDWPVTWAPDNPETFTVR